MRAKFRALEIANFYIQMVNGLSDNHVDNLKINKLLYYVQGFSLVRLGRPLFSDEIQAWDYGPVIPEVYHTFKCCGSNAIEEPTESFNEGRLSSEELDLLIDVYSQYGRYTGWALKDMTHQQGSPWRAIYEPNQNRIISLESMRNYFKHEVLSPFDMEKLNIPVVTQIPVEWDSDEDAVYG